MSANPQQIGESPFSSEQTHYLDGFFAGVKNRGLAFADVDPEAGPKPKEKKKKITPEEQLKAEFHPFDSNGMAFSGSLPSTKAICVAFASPGES